MKSRVNNNQNNLENNNNQPKGKEIVNEPKIVEPKPSENNNKESIKDLFAIEMFSEVIVKNPVLVSTIGLCPVVAICTSLQSALVLTAITYLTMIFAQVLSSLIFRKCDQWIRIALYSLSGMAIVAPAMMLLQKVFPDNLIAMGLYLPLLVINPLITRQCERVAVKGTVKKAFVNAVSCATGYGIVLIITGFLREFLGNGTIWEAQVFDNPPVSSFTNPFAGFIVLGFLAALLRLYFKKIDPKYAEELSVHSRSNIKKKKPRKHKSRANSLITEYEKNRNVAKKNDQDKVENLDNELSDKTEPKVEEKQPEEAQKTEKTEQINKDKLDTKQEEIKIEEKIIENPVKQASVLENNKEEIVQELDATQEKTVEQKPKVDYSQEKTKPIDNDMINSILAEYKNKEPAKKQAPNETKKDNKIVYSSEELEKLMAISIEDLIEMSSKNSKANDDEKDNGSNKQEVPEE